MILIPVVEIIRLEENYEFGTFGSLRINKQLFCTTLELPDLLNKRSMSSIPAQQYLCKRYSSQKYPDTFQVVNVPDRSFILWHPGNRKKDTRGCILLGQYPSKLQGNWFDRGVWNSGNTFATFMEIFVGYDVFHLTITENY